MTIDTSSPFSPLTIRALCDEARAFAEIESTYPEPSLYGVTDGKAVGTYLEHKFKAHLSTMYSYAAGNSAVGIDFPELGVDLKVTSIMQPPKTWRYLQEHSAYFERRSSSIYRGRPRFSLFGVGDYTFSPWKVAISGFYKRIRFVAVGPQAGKPTILDDTCYFVPCQTEDEACTLCEVLNSIPSREFYEAFVFWDSKRPITAELLRRLDIRALAGALGVQPPRLQYFKDSSITIQPTLF